MSTEKILNHSNCSSYRLPIAGTVAVITAVTFRKISNANNKSMLLPKILWSAFGSNSMANLWRAYGFCIARSPVDLTLMCQSALLVARLNLTTISGNYANSHF
jgi:hypothetical protein